MLEFFSQKYEQFLGLSESDKPAIERMAELQALVEIAGTRVATGSIPTEDERRTYRFFVNDVITERARLALVLPGWAPDPSLFHSYPV